MSLRVDFIHFVGIKSILEAFGEQHSYSIGSLENPSVTLSVLNKAIAELKMYPVVFVFQKVLDTTPLSGRHPNQQYVHSNKI